VNKTAELLPGTLDMLILKAVCLKPLHSYDVLLRIRQIQHDGARACGKDSTESRLRHTHRQQPLHAPPGSTCRANSRRPKETRNHSDWASAFFERLFRAQVQVSWFASPFGGNIW
jgi:hypothetical protein